MVWWLVRGWYAGRAHIIFDSNDTTRSPPRNIWATSRLQGRNTCGLITDTSKHGGHTVVDEWLNNWPMMRRTSMGLLKLLVSTHSSYEHTSRLYAIVTVGRPCSDLTHKQKVCLCNVRSRDWVVVVFMWILLTCSIYPLAKVRKSIFIGLTQQMHTHLYKICGRRPLSYNYDLSHHYK